MSAEQKTRLLIIDDEKAIRRSMAEYLEDFDFEVEEAESGEIAINKCLENVFDAAIVDLRLPGVTGDALIIQLHKKYPQMKFMIHTGSCEFKIPEQLKELGITDGHIIHKPVIDLNKLVEQIRELTS